MKLKKVALVIVDITGYTGFLKFHKTSLLHAHEIISQLLESVIDKTSHPLTLNKLEGDAALMYAELGEDEVSAGRDIVVQTKAFFDAFHTKARELSGSRSNCPCEACQRILDLKLKTILHIGHVAFRRIRQFNDEMAGEDVILIHLLLKNTVAEDEYILMTEPYHSLSGDVPGYLGRVHQELCEGVGPVPVRVYSLNRYRPAFLSGRTGERPITGHSRWTSYFVKFIERIAL